MHAIIAPAIEDLCAAFERGGYNPTPLVDLGVLVANADGHVSERERELLSEVFQALLETQLTPEVVDALITASVEVTLAAGAGPRSRLVAAILQDCDAVEPGLRVALAIAFASEGLSAAERAVIDGIAEAAGLDKSRVDELVEEMKRHIDEGGPESARMSLVHPA
ncbi:MAG: TerB family tellurite resistance protein [Myxococcales bacterium]|nr:TerB family tellurite resistance protein [Myxococcales bacterium]